MKSLKAFQYRIKDKIVLLSVINLTEMALHSSLFVVVVVLVVSVIMSTSGLQCHICGEYNDGQGSITPCLNYTESNAHLHLKECRRKTDKFCVVSLLM